MWPPDTMDGGGKPKIEVVLPSKAFILKVKFTLFYVETVPSKIKEYGTVNLDPTNASSF